MRTDIGLGSLGNQTWETLYNSMYKDAAAKAALRTAEGSVLDDNYAAMKKLAETRQIYQDMLQSGDLHPIEKAKLEREVKRIDSEIAENAADTKLAGARTTKTETDTRKTQQEIAAEEERQAILTALQGDPSAQIEDLNVGTQIKALGANATQDFRTGQLNDSRIRELETKQQEFQQHQKAYAALSRIDTDEASAADVDEWNSNAPDDATFGVIWTGETGWGDGISDDEPLRVELPSGYTMKDVRHSATLRGMTVEQVLRQIWEKGQ